MAARLKEPAVKAYFPAIVADAVAVSMPSVITVAVDLFDDDVPGNQQVERGFVMRRQGRSWSDISKATGVPVHRLKYYWDRFGRSDAT